MRDAFFEDLCCKFCIENTSLCVCACMTGSLDVSKTVLYNVSQNVTITRSLKTIPDFSLPDYRAYLHLCIALLCINEWKHQMSDCMILQVILQTADTECTATEHSCKHPLVSNRPKSHGESGSAKSISRIHLSQGMNVTGVTNNTGYKTSKISSSS